MTCTFHFIRYTDEIFLNLPELTWFIFTMSTINLASKTGSSTVICRRLWSRTGHYHCLCRCNSVWYWLRRWRCIKKIDRIMNNKQCFFVRIFSNSSFYDGLSLTQSLSHITLQRLKDLLVVNINSSFYGGLSLTHLLSHWLPVWLWIISTCAYAFATKGFQTLFLVIFPVKF